MLKFLRQYNQWILAVGGTLLLITFLMPNAIQRCGRDSGPTNVVFARLSDGATYTGGDQNAAQQELAVLEPMRDPFVTGLGADRSPEHWWLLVREATAAGLVDPTSGGQAEVERVAASQKISTQQLMSLLLSNSRAEGKQDTVYRALANLAGVRRLVTLASNVDRLSDRRFKNEIARSMLGVSADLVILDAKTNAAITAAVPTDAELEAQFAAFASIVKGTGEKGFGYRLPNRVKLEWMMIPKASIETAIASSPQLATLELKKRFAADPAIYGADPLQNPTFATYEATVRQRTKDELVKQRMDEVAKFVTDESALALRSVKRVGAFYELPADWSTTMPSLQALAVVLAKEFSMDLPVYQTSGADFISPADLALLPGIGRASTSKFGSPLRSDALAGGLKEFGADGTKAPFQVAVMSPSMTSEAGDLYFFRVLEADASRAPASLADARDAVLKDLESVRRYEWLAANQATLVSEAVAGGMAPLATKYGTAVEFAAQVREANPQFVQYGVRLPSPLPVLGTNADALKRIVDAATALPLTAPVGEVEISKRTFAVDLPNQLTVLLVQITDLTPLSAEEFTAMSTSPQLAGIARDPSTAIDPRELFSEKSLMERAGFKSEGSGDLETPAKDAQTNAAK
ncbi:MAG: hypothetical protein EXS10_06585 [Phycisphaerales bacterium]|nr:hypothetical protein [Phycisphaerales bacterium]